MKSSGGTRALEIILGLIAIVIGVMILIFPAFSIATVTFILGIGLLLIGIFRFGWGLASRNISGGVRAAAIVIGLIAIGIAIAVLAFPLLAAATVVVIISIAVLIYGIGRIATGATAPISGGLRGLLIGTGLLMVVLSIIVIIYPGLGIAFLAFLLSIAFLIIGVESIAAGAVGTKYTPQVPGMQTMKP